MEKALTPPRRCLCVAMSRFCGVSNYTCLPRANVSLREVKRKLGHHLLRVIEHGVEPAVVRMSGSRSRGETHRPCGPRAPGSRRRTVPARRSWGGTRSGDGVRRRLFDWIFCGSDFLAFSIRTRHFLMRCDDDARTGDVAMPIVVRSLREGLLDARRVTAQAGRGRTSRPLVAECSGWLDARRDASSRPAQACWRRRVIVVRSLREGLLDERRDASLLLKRVVDARRDPSSPLRLVGRTSRPLVTECSG